MDRCRSDLSVPANESTPHDQSPNRLILGSPVAGSGSSIGACRRWRPDDGSNVNRPDSLHYFLFADDQEVISGWLDSKCQGG
jgi:hypothetical protein